MTKNNHMICDLETGVCGVAGESNMEIIDLTPPKKTVDVYYVTDPICSHCWAFEPVLRRFVAQYGHHFNFHTVMGGLLEKWGDGPVDVKNGIFGPADVVPHWREVGVQSRMPIDGTVMIDNPVQSSYPPSRVFKAIQKEHSDALASTFLRRAREQLFVFNQNISDPSVLIAIVNGLGLDGEAIVRQADQSVGHRLLSEDFELARNLGVRGFPTLVMVNQDNQGVKIGGARGLDAHAEGLKQTLGVDELEAKQPPSLASLLEQEKLLFSKEIEVLYDLEPSEIDAFVERKLTAHTFEAKETLGETYYEQK